MALIPIDIRKIQRRREQAKVILDFFREDNVDSRDIFQTSILWIKKKKGGHINE